MTCLIVLTSCEAVFENDISKSTITVNSPADGYCSPVSTVIFWWEPLKGAEEYEIQLVTPGFDSIREFIADTAMPDCRLSLYLAPGHYQWRIRAVNSAYFSEYFTRSFTVTGTADLSLQIMHLLTPEDHDTTNMQLMTISWDSVPQASQYRFEIWDPDQTGTLIHSMTTNETSIVYTFTADGTFEWKVRAENQLGMTPYSSRTILIDTGIPAAPQLLLPAHNTTVSGNQVLFQWQHDNTPGALISDSLQAATDVQFTNKVINIKTSLTIYTDSIASGNYYWRVRSKDAAGNEGNWSTVFQFLIP